VAGQPDAPWLSFFAPQRLNTLLGKKEGMMMLPTTLHIQ